MIFMPSAWYWKDDGGVIYSGRANALIGNDDPDYQAWLAAGNFPTVWPRDSSGKQTTDALNAVLTSFDLPAYAPKS